VIRILRPSRLALCGLLVASIGLGACGSDGDGTATEASPADAVATAGTDDPSAAAAPTDPASGGSAAPAAIECPATDGSTAQRRSFAAPLPMCIDPAKTYTATVETTKGTFTITFDAAKAPATVNNFVTLARFKYFDGIGFHRVVPGFVIQGGDPEGTGMGGPGYTFDDELPRAGEYEIGSLAMANAGPNTNGSQFFVITGEAGAGLPPQYSLFGKVTEGMDVVMAIDALGQGDGPPSEPVTMTTVTITES
jgi:peptidylprolyl isomerase/peptidyl-prolyl cis-trans isomerase B (cyclophilin B)